MIYANRHTHTLDSNHNIYAVAAHKKETKKIMCWFYHKFLCICMHIWRLYVICHFGACVCLDMKWWNWNVKWGLECDCSFMLASFWIFVVQYGEKQSSECAVMAVCARACVWRVEHISWAYDSYVCMCHVFHFKWDRDSSTKREKEMLNRCFLPLVLVFDWA